MEMAPLIMITIILVIILAIIILVLGLINKFKRFYTRSGMGQIINAAKNVRELETQEYSRPKNVIGMTKLVEPRIMKDFSDFNKDMLYEKVESNLRKIFNCYESKNSDSIKNDQELALVRNDIEERINDLKSTGKEVKYDMVKFHRHALKSYKKDNKMATIEVSSTVEYYYIESGNEKQKLAKHINDAIKQTRYTTTFVYAYDESNFKSSENVFGLNCPNCGAPLNRLEAKTCNYCGTHVEDINLKVWKMTSFKEDY